MQLPNYAILQSSYDMVQGPLLAGNNLARGFMRNRGKAWHFWIPKAYGGESNTEEV